MNLGRRSRPEPHIPFLLGLLVGGVAVALFAPFAGRDVRRRVSEAAKSGGGAVADGWRKTRESAGAVAANLMEQGKERVKDETARLQSAVQAAKTAYNEPPVS